MNIYTFLSVSLTWDNKYLSAVSAEHHDFPFTAVDLCPLSIHENKTVRAYKWEAHLLYLPSLSTAFCWMTLSCHRIGSRTKQCELFDGAQPPHTHGAHKAWGIHAASFKTSQLFYELCRLFALPASLTFMHTKHSQCHFQKPSGSCGKVSSSWDQPQVSREGSKDLLSSLEGFANQVISSALHHTGVCVY